MHAGHHLKPRKRHAPLHVCLRADRRRKRRPQMADGGVGAGGGGVVDGEKVEQPGARWEHRFGEGHDGAPGHVPRKGASEELADDLVVVREPNLRGAATQIQATASVTLMAIQMTRITLILHRGSDQCMILSYYSESSLKRAVHESKGGIRRLDTDFRVNARVNTKDFPSQFASATSENSFLARRRADGKCH